MSSSARRSHYVVAMPTSLVRRVEVLEGDVNALRHLPEQVSAVAGDLAALRGDVTHLQGDVTHLQGDVVQLKGDMAEVRTDVAQLQRDMTEVRTDVAQLKRDMTEVRSALSDGHDGLINVRAEFAAVRDEIRTGDEETRRQMRVLHEEVISRIALLDEGRKTRRRRKK